MAQAVIVLRSYRSGDMRALTNTNGTLSDNNRVVSKADASAPEVPVARARVAVHATADGAVFWCGLSDATGHYFPANLRVGDLYYASALDLSGAHEAVAAGPIVATAKLWN